MYAGPVVGVWSRLAPADRQRLAYAFGPENDPHFYEAVALSRVGAASPRPNQNCTALFRPNDGILASELITWLHAAKSLLPNGATGSSPQTFNTKPSFAKLGDAVMHRGRAAQLVLEVLFSK